MTFQYPDLPEKFDKFQEALSWASGCPVYWALQSDEGLMREADVVWAEIQVYKMGRLGTDETTYTDVGGDYPLLPAQSGNRLVTFQVNFRSRSQEHATSAWYAATKAHMRLMGGFARTAFLRPWDLAVATLGEIIDTLGGFTYDNRSEDVALFEITLATTLTDIDESLVIAAIEHTEVTTGLKYPDASNLPSDLQLDEELMP